MKEPEEVFVVPDDNIEPHTPVEEPLEHPNGEEDKLIEKFPPLDDVVKEN